MKAQIFLPRQNSEELYDNMDNKTLGNDERDTNTTEKYGEPSHTLRQKSRKSIVEPNFNYDTKKNSNTGFEIIYTSNNDSDLDKSKSNSDNQIIVVYKD